MIPGALLLGLLALVVGLRWRKLRRRRGLGVAREHWAVAAVVLAAAIFALWITSRGMR